MDQMQAKNVLRSSVESRRSSSYKKALIRKNIPLFIMLVIPLIFFLVFKYIPMFGTAIAFKDYQFNLGIWRSPWVGMQNFQMIFRQKYMRQIIINTVRLGILGVVVPFPFPIILAIMLNEMQGNHLKKLTQTILYLPHFISWVVVSGMIIQIFSSNGPINSLIKAVGGNEKDFLYREASWTAIYLGSGIWKEMGFNAIVYLAALTAIDPGYYEAAKIDGATKLQQIIKITIPSIMPTVVLMLILASGRVMSVGFDRIYVLRNAAVSSTSSVVSTFVYEMGVRGGEFSITTAMGLFDSVVNLMLISSANALSKQYSNSSIF
ncbi:MAG: ABC transporter permease [Christensenellales bacterium]|jgi:putative aldouronate transport system permease protein